MESPVRLVRRDRLRRAVGQKSNLIRDLIGSPLKIFANVLLSKVVKVFLGNATPPQNADAIFRLHTDIHMCIGGRRTW